MTDEDIISGILKREGAEYSADPADKGGPTKYGITLAALSEWRGALSTPSDVQALQESEARDIYRAQYIKKPGFSAIPSARLRGLLVDCAVNHGPSRATRWLQVALGVAADGVLGTDTREAVRFLDSDHVREVFNSVCANRVRFYGRLVHDDPTQIKWIRGWLERAAEFIEAGA